MLQTRDTTKIKADKSKEGVRGKLPPAHFRAVSFPSQLLKPMSFPLPAYFL